MLCTIHCFAQAFRYLSHKFHGKIPGKLKTEKRQKKVSEDEVGLSPLITQWPNNEFVSNSIT